MARDIVNKSDSGVPTKTDKKDSKKKSKKDKKKNKKRKKSSTSSSSDSSSSEDLTEMITPEELQLQLGLRTKDVRLNSGKCMRYEDLSPEPLLVLMLFVSVNLSPDVN